MSADLSTVSFAALAELECLALTLPDFGDGSMLFDLWQRWRHERPANRSRLHLVVHAAQPVPSDALSHQPVNAALRALLLCQYPPAIDGVHRLIFTAERITIDLWFGDAATPSPPSTLVANVPSHFVVIGAGIAGLSMVHALTLRGHPVTLIEQDTPLSGGSGNPRALLLSKLPKRARVQHNLQTLGGLSTARWWQAWADDVITATGALLLPDADDLDKAAGYPADLVERLDPAAVEQRTGMTSTCDQLYLPRAAILDPAALSHHVLASPLIARITAQVARLSQSNQQWQLLDHHDTLITRASHVIVAGAKDSARLCPTLPPLTVIRGQMAWCTTTADAPELALGYGGYAVKFDQTLLLGSSFVRDDETTDIRRTEHQAIYDLLHAAYPDYAATLPDLGTWQGRASLRALPRDSMPLVGSVPNMAGVYALTGMGSKGFSFAPLCAEWLTSHLLGEPLPLPELLGKQISPSRFIKPERVRKPYYKPPI